MSEFQHPDYEYRTLTVPFDTKALSGDFDRQIHTEMGFTRVWADVTENGIYIVYRRPRKVVEPRFVGPTHQFRTEAIGYLPIELKGPDQNRLVEILTRLVDGQVERIRTLLANTPTTYGEQAASKPVDTLRNIVSAARAGGWDGNLVKRCQGMWPEEQGFDTWSAAANVLFDKKNP